MMRLFKILLFGTLIFNVFYATYQVNVLKEKVESINVVLGRIHSGQGALNAIKKDFNATASTLQKYAPDALAGPGHFPDGKWPEHRNK